MFKIVLLSLALTGLQALPISRRLTKTHHSVPVEVQDGLSVPLSEGFRQGTEPSRRFIVDLTTGLVQDYISEMNRRTGLLSPPLGNGHGEMSRKHWLRDNTAEEVLVQKNGGGWLRVEEHAKLPDGYRQGTEPTNPENHKEVAISINTKVINTVPYGFRQGTERSNLIPDGFRQGTERFMPIPEGFRQGTERFMPIPEGFRQGTERFMPIPDGFRQGTERFMPIPEGFRQGTERFMPIPDGFRQGTERFMPIPDGFRQGTERFMPIPDGFRQGTERFMPIPDGFRQGTERFMPIPDGFRQGTERFMPIPDGFRQGTERFMPIPDGFRQGTEPFLNIPNGFRQGTEPSHGVPDVYKQGIKRFTSFPDGFRQGTEPRNPADHRDVAISFKDLPAVPPNQILEGFRPGAGPFMPVWDGNRQNIQGIETFMPIPDGFRQGTEPRNPADHRDVAISFKDLPAVPSNQIQEGFRPGVGPFMPVRDGNGQDIQGIETFMPIPDGFRQGTEPMNPLHHKEAAISFKDLPAVPSNQIEGFRPGVGPFMPVRDGNGQDIQPLNHIHTNFNHAFETARQRTNTARCNGEVINGRCYTFNSTPLPFLEAQDSCKSLSPNAELAAVTNEDLHSRLVSMVTKGGQRDPVMTWLGGTVKNQRGSWLDGSEWRYSDWMPGQPNIHTDKPVCVEMFRMGETWWTAADCDLKKASICSYPVA